jgi:uncharacterized protein
LSERAVLTEQRQFEAPLTIGVLADTHIFRGGSRQLPGEVLDLFRRFKCGLIAHAGDCNTLHVLGQLAAIAPVIAVTGNNDDAALRAVAPRELEFMVGSVRFAMIHGDGGDSARAVAKARFGGVADLVIYGHSHIPMIEQISETRYFNPGSPTDRRWHEHFGVGLIHVSASGARPELIVFKQPGALANVQPD